LHPLPLCITTPPTHPSMPPYYTSSPHSTSGRGPTHTYVVRTHGRHNGRRTHETRDPVRHRPRHGNGHHRQVHYSASTPRYTTHQPVRTPPLLPNDRERMLLTCVPHYHASTFTQHRRGNWFTDLLCCRPHHRTSTHYPGRNRIYTV